MYDSQNGIYEGATFEEPDIIHNEEGFTTIPPPEYENGQVAVFERRNNKWTVIPLNIAKQLLNGNAAEPTENKS